MRSFSETIRDEVWARLREIYLKFTGGDNNITIPQVQKFIIEVLGQKNRDEIGYVTSNISRLDQDGNGFIEFEEFANFLLKQHCGEIALQKMHRNGKITNQNVYKINFQEFNVLLNNAYEFLGIHPDPNQTALLFNQADQDQDGLITYGEYFQFVQKFICRPKLKISQRQVPVTPQRIEFNSRFRRFLWDQLIRIFSAYDFNRNRMLEYAECQRMLRDLFPTASQTEIQIVLRGIFSNGATSISFDQFVRMFIINVFDRSIIWHFGNKTHLSREQFINLVRRTLVFIDIDRVQDILLWRLYDRIDTDGDGLISLGQYQRWFTNFLAVLSYYGSEYITQDDDLSLGIGNQYILAAALKTLVTAPIVQSSIPPTMTVNSSAVANTQQVIVRRQVRTSGGINFNPFNFSSQQLALRIRGHLMKLLMRFDANNNMNFQEEEIIQMLVTLMKQDRNQIMYVIANVFRYDRNNDRRVTYDEMADFFLESHCGQLAIQRLHKKDLYQRGTQKMMNMDQFIYTLNYALSFIEIQATPQELAVLFREIDRDHDGWISYREYFEFLKYYFGSKSYAAVQTTIQRIETLPITEIIPPILNEFEVILMDEGLSLEERLRRMLRLHLNKTLDAYDFDGNRVLTSNQIVSLLQTVFGYNSEQIDFVMEILKRNQVMKREQFVDLLLGIHFHEFGFMKNLRLERFGQSDFARILDLLCSFLTVRLSPEQYLILFRNLDVGRGGYITITQWEDFISRLFGKHVYRTRVIVQDTGLYGQIWGQFRRIFSLYDGGNKGYLTQAELELFLREVMLQCQHKHRSTVINDLLKLGPVNFERFASVILARCAENALHRFHLQQPPGKDRLSQREFVLLVKSAYDFLKPISKHTDFIKKSYSTINTKYPDGIDYKMFIDWAYRDVARNL